MGKKYITPERKREARKYIVRLFADNIQCAFTIDETISDMDGVSSEIGERILNDLYGEGKLRRGKVFLEGRGRGSSPWYYYVPTEYEGEILEWLRSELAKDISGEVSVADLQQE